MLWVKPLKTYFFIGIIMEEEEEEEEEEEKTENVYPELINYLHVKQWLNYSN